MKIKTSELSGVQLDWAVGHIQGYAEGPCGSFWITEDDCVDFKPTTDWSQGGPIIEREGISLDYIGVGEGIRVQAWQATTWSADNLMSSGSGPTPLVAAMRCFVASELGDEVEVPDELKEEEVK